MTRNLQTLASGLVFAEGPRWHDGALYISDMHGRRVLRIEDDGEVKTVAEIGDMTSGLGWLPDGRLLVVSMEARKILRQEADGTIALHADLGAIATHNCNDMIVAADGTAYVGNFGFSLFPMGTPCTAAVARITPKGVASVGGDGLWFPNGLAITADGKTLIVAESAAYCLTAFTIAPDGSLSGKRLWAQLPDGHAPDGLCLDAEGAAWVAVPHLNKYIRVREGGEVADTIEVEGYALACVLGGADRRTLYMAISGEIEPDKCLENPSASVVATRVEVAGSGRP